MKKYFFLFALSMLFVGCSSDGSREIQIDECNYAHSDLDKTEEFSKVMSVLEVVPGKYELGWTLVHNTPVSQNYAISLNLKLRLKRKVNVNDDIIKKVSEAKDGDHAFLSPFKFELLDADGKRENVTVQQFDLSYTSLAEWSKSTSFNKDQVMDFLRFLQSEPGTEIELHMYAFGSKNSDINCIEVCKNAKGVICVLEDTDNSFERNIGTIQ